MMPHEASDTEAPLNHIVLQLVDAVQAQRQDLEASLRASQAQYEDELIELLATVHDACAALLYHRPVQFDAVEAVLDEALERVRLHWTYRRSQQ
jgi:hypothetical protein